MEKYLKAFFGAVTAGLATLATAYTDNEITGPEWVTIAIATLTAFGAVWGVTNKKENEDEKGEDPGQ